MAETQVSRRTGSFACGAATTQGGASGTRARSPKKARSGRRTRRAQEATRRKPPQAARARRVEHGQAARGARRGRRRGPRPRRAHATICSVTSRASRESFERLNIVALNAGLEGARLGEAAGKPLSLVSEEVRAQAERGGESVARDRALARGVLARDLRAHARFDDARGHGADVTQQASAAAARRGRERARARASSASAFAPRRAAIPRPRKRSRRPPSTRARSSARSAR